MVNAIDILRGGATAIVSPALVAALLPCVVTGLTAAALGGRRLLLPAAVGLPLLYAAGVLLPLLEIGDRLRTLFAASMLFLLLLLSWPLRRELLRAWATAGGLAVLIALLRVDANGPVLSSLAGPWGSSPAIVPLLLYHVVSGLLCGGIFLLAAVLGRRLRRTAVIAGRAMTALVMLAILSGLWSLIDQRLLLGWPLLRMG